MPILKIEKLTKKYGKTYALNGLDMEVKKGDIYGFVGPNGAGKTTTLRIISGLLKSDGGDLWLDGVRTTKNILKQKSLIGFVPDFFGVYENLNVIEYLELFTGGQEPSVRGKCWRWSNYREKRSRWWICSQGAYSSGSVWRAR